jgi:alkylation response protein AidB-like acyl-CoA dehydrogenase
MTTNEDIRMLRDMVRDFTDSEIRPLAAAIDQNESIPQELIAKLGEVGLLGTAFPEEYGGGGFGEYGFCVAQEEVVKACGSTATLIGAHQSIGTNAIYLGGSEELKQKYMFDLTAGKKIAAFALTEPEAGSDAFNLKTTARFDGNNWILNGQKIWITNAAIADVYSVFASLNTGHHRDSGKKAQSYKSPRELAAIDKWQTELPGYPVVRKHENYSVMI